MMTRILPSISFDDVRLIMTIVEQQNFTRAANILNMTQPALSKRVSALEHVLGVRLIDRDRRPIVLTAEGDFLIQRWIKIFEDIQGSIMDVSEVGPQ